MDFVLGILVGIIVVMAYSQYLSERQRKQREKDAQRLNAALNKIFDGLQKMSVSSLEAQLQDAIERDDFEAAARIRDLMNRK